MAAKSTKGRYSQADKARSLINNEHLSDISFLVGSNEDQKMICGHKFLLLMGSPVFEAMFVGSLPEKNDVIEVPDLTATGFLNIIRYIYGEEMDFVLHESYDTFMAGQKYMVYGLCDAILDHLTSSLNNENRILIYDQLVKIKAIDESIGDKLLKNIRDSINKSSFLNNFNKISVDTLVDILNIETLDIDEFNILKSCINWANESNSTIEDKRASFESVMPYINFSRITIDNLKEIKKPSLNSFLIKEEVADLFLFLVDRDSPCPFEIKTKRKRLLTVNCMNIPYNPYNNTGLFDSFRIEISSSHNILIKSIKTSLSSLENVEVNVLDQNISKDFKDGKLSFVFPSYAKIGAGGQYLLEFKFSSCYIEFNKLSAKTESVVEHADDKITLKFSLTRHGIERIDFCIDDI